MTEDDPSAPEIPLSQFDEEAATWFARMRGPDAAAHREAFEKWLALGALHRATYNRIAEIWVESGILKERPERPADATDVGANASEAPTRRRLVVPLGLLAAGAATAIAISPWARPSSDMASPDRSAQTLTQPQLQTALGQIRRVALPDRSVVVLDTDSLLTLAYNDRERALRLERGRARFEVAHDARPFVVAVGQGTVTARGTVFDVELAADRRVHVLLVRGAVDVRGVASDLANASPPALLAAGQTLSFAAAGGPPSPPQRASVSDWPSGNAEFDNAPLAEIVEQANRYSAIKIVLAEAAIGQLRVSGTFRIEDTRTLAARLAALFGLTVTPRSTSLVLSKK